MREYVKDDYLAVLSWFVAQTGGYMPEELLSPIGLIIPNMAAGFILCTNTKACFLEPFIANPDAEYNDRAKALKEIMSALLLKAKSLGYQYAYGISTAPTMLDRAKDLGFLEIPGKHTVLIKELS